MTTLERVQKVAAEELGLELSEIKPDSSFRALGADSLEMVSLLNALEDEFGIQIPDDDFQKILTVQDAAAYAAR
jgi:acyl carrier protein